MKIIDRFLVVRRAVIIALSKDIDAVLIKQLDSKGNTKKNCIFSNYEKAKDFYTKDMINFFTDNAKTAAKLEHFVNVFIQWVELDWNKKHPKDTVSFFKESGDANNP